MPLSTFPPCRPQVRVRVGAEANDATNSGDWICVDEAGCLVAPWTSQASTVALASGPKKTLCRRHGWHGHLHLVGTRVPLRQATRAKDDKSNRCRTQREHRTLRRKPPRIRARKSVVRSSGARRTDRLWVSPPAEVPFLARLIGQRKWRFSMGIECPPSDNLEPRRA